MPKILLLLLLLLLLCTAGRPRFLLHNVFFSFFDIEAIAKVNLTILPVSLAHVSHFFRTRFILCTWGEHISRFFFSVLKFYVPHCSVCLWPPRRPLSVALWPHFRHVQRISDRSFSSFGFILRRFNIFRAAPSLRSEGLSSIWTHLGQFEQVLDAFWAG